MSIIGVHRYQFKTRINAARHSNLKLFKIYNSELWTIVQLCVYHFMVMLRGIV